MWFGPQRAIAKRALWSGRVQGQADRGGRTGKWTRRAQAGCARPARAGRRCCALKPAPGHAPGHARP
eukprot:5520707-Alexandrium_andersonii.AAC.1